MVEIVKNRPQELTRAELEIMQVLWTGGLRSYTASSMKWRSRNPPTTPCRRLSVFWKRRDSSATRPMARPMNITPLISKDAYARRYMDTVLNNFFRRFREPPGIVFLGEQRRFRSRRPMPSSKCCANANNPGHEIPAALPSRSALLQRTAPGVLPPAAGPQRFHSGPAAVIWSLPYFSRRSFRRSTFRSTLPGRWSIRCR